MNRRRWETESELALIGYVRVSTEEQALSGLSIDAQKSRLRAHAKAHGYTLLDIEVDAGISGKVAPKRRPGLARVLKAIRERRAKGVVFLKLDRLSRSVRHILELADSAARKGWHVVSVNDHIDTSTASGKFMLGILAVLAEMERDQISERTVLAMNQVALEGRARSRFLPFGYRIKGAPSSTTMRAGDRRPLVEDKEELELLRRMQRLQRQGLGAQRIAKTMSKRGPNPRTGEPWKTSNVAGILRSAEKRTIVLEKGEQRINGDGRSRRRRRTDEA